MSSDSIFMTGRNALVATLVAIALNPLAIFFGYYLSKELGKPRVFIEFVKPNIEYKKIKIEKNIIDIIRYNKDLFNKIIGLQYLDEIQRMMSGDTEIDPGKWMALLLTDISEGFVSHDFVTSTLSRKQTINNDYDVKIFLTNKNIEALKVQKNFDSSVINEVPGFENEPIVKAGAISIEEALNLMKARLQKIISEKAGFEIITTEFEKISSNQNKERNGDIAFEIGFLNSGDTDGVVYPDGNMLINGYRVEIRQQAYMVVKPHSFSKYIFMINKEKTSNDALELLKNILQKGLPEEYTIEIVTSGKKAIKTAKLPVK